MYTTARCMVAWHWPLLRRDRCSGCQLLLQHLIADALAAISKILIQKARRRECRCGVDGMEASDPHCGRFAQVDKELTDRRAWHSSTAPVSITAEPVFCIDLQTILQEPGQVPMIRADPYAPQTRIEPSDAAWKANASAGASTAVHTQCADAMLPEMLAAQSDQQWAKADETLRAQAKWLDCQLMSLVAVKSECIAENSCGSLGSDGCFAGTDWKSSAIVPGTKRQKEVVTRHLRKTKIRARMIQKSTQQIHCNIHRCQKQKHPTMTLPKLEILTRKQAPNKDAGEEKRQNRNRARRRNAARMSYATLYDRINALRQDGTNITRDNLSVAFQRCAIPVSFL